MKKLTQTEIEKVMKDTNYQESCCNSYWPPRFAEAIMKAMIAKEKQELAKEKVK